MRIAEFLIVAVLGFVIYLGYVPLPLAPCRMTHDQCQLQRVGTEYHTSLYSTWDGLRRHFERAAILKNLILRNSPALRLSSMLSWWACGLCFFSSGLSDRLPTFCSSKFLFERPTQSLAWCCCFYQSFS